MHPHGLRLNLFTHSACKQEPRISIACTYMCTLACVVFLGARFFKIYFAFARINKKNVMKREIYSSRWCCFEVHQKVCPASLFVIGWNILTLSSTRDYIDIPDAGITNQMLLPNYRIFLSYLTEQSMQDYWCLVTPLKESSGDAAKLEWDGSFSAENMEPSIWWV